MILPHWEEEKKKNNNNKEKEKTKGPADIQMFLLLNSAWHLGGK